MAPGRLRRVRALLGLALLSVAVVTGSVLALEAVPLPSICRSQFMILCAPPTYVAPDWTPMVVLGGTGAVLLLWTRRAAGRAGGRTDAPSTVRNRPS